MKETGPKNKDAFFFNSVLPATRSYFLRSQVRLVFADGLFGYLLAFQLHAGKVATDAGRLAFSTFGRPFFWPARGRTDPACEARFQGR